MILVSYMLHDTGVLYVTQYWCLICYIILVSYMLHGTGVLYVTRYWFLICYMKGKMRLTLKRLTHSLRERPDSQPENHCRTICGMEVTTSGEIFYFKKIFGNVVRKTCGNSRNTTEYLTR